MTNYLTSVGVQHFSITIASGATSGTATINAVGAGAFIVYGGQFCPLGGNPAVDFASMTLTNSTTITATRNTSIANTVTIKGCIVDGDTTNLIVSVQYGNVTIADTASTGTASISAVTNNNAYTHYLGLTSANVTTVFNNDSAVLSLSGTTVTATRIGTVGAINLQFVVIEFQSAALNQAIQNVSATSSSNVTSYTATITSVDTTNTILLYAGNTTNTTSPAVWGLRATLTNGTTVTITSNTGAAVAKTFNCGVVEFISGVLNSAPQYGTTAFTTAQTSNTTTITSVTTANSLAGYLGTSSDAINVLTSNRFLSTTALTAATTITATRGIAASNATDAWDVGEFVPFSAGAGTLLPFPWMHNSGGMQDMTGGMRQ